MRRILAAALLATALPLVSMSAAHANSGGTAASQCKTLGEGANPVYSNNGGASDPLVFFQQYVGPFDPATGQTTVPSCRGVIYSAYVYDVAGNLLGTQSFRGDGTTTVFVVNIPVPTNPATGAPYSEVCLAATSASTDGHLYDYHPSDGPSGDCHAGYWVPYNGGSGGGYFH